MLWARQWCFLRRGDGGDYRCGFRFWVKDGRGGGHFLRVPRYLMIWDSLGCGGGGGRYLLVSKILPMIEQVLVPDDCWVRCSGFPHALHLR